MKQAIVKGLSHLAPQIAAQMAYQMWTKTKHYERPQRELACHEQARRQLLSIKQQQIVVYRWGSGPRILMLHGWNGRASQMFVQINALISAGFEVIAFDQPGFGGSEGKHSGLLPIKAALELVVKQYAPFESIIAHSFGFLVAINSNPPLLTKSLIGIAPPASFNWLLDGFSTLENLSPVSSNRLKHFVCEKYRISTLDEISIKHLGAQLKTIRGMILYDQNDNKVPRQQIDEIMQFWPEAVLKETKGLGHTRILYDEPLAQFIVNFLKEIL